MMVRITLLGGFDVAVDGVATPLEAWSRRQAASLVKLLAMAPGRRMHREQVVDALWPGLSLEAAGPRLHKAAHYARRALGAQTDSLVLRHDVVALLPGSDVEVDAVEFGRLAHEAVSDGSATAAVAALGWYGGPFLPDDVYEPWTEEHREGLRSLQVDVLRVAGRWEDLLEVDPADEQAHVALATASADRGDVRGALRQLERLDQALRSELGTQPGSEARRLRDQLLARVGASAAAERPAVRLYGRKSVGDQIRTQLERAADGRGGTLVLVGPSGVGKSALLDLASSVARQRGLRVGRGSASAVEGSWPYAPVLEAFSDLCRGHPALLDGLADDHRAELERALSGQDMAWSGESSHQRLFVAAAELMRLAAAGNGLLLVVDDLHEADESSLRLVHYLSRCALAETVLLLIAHRPADTAQLRQVTDSLVARGAGSRLLVPPLTEEAVLRVIEDTSPDLPSHTARQLAGVSGGLPFAAIELAREAAVRGRGGLQPVLPGSAEKTFQRLALMGSAFSTDELLAVAGVDEEEAYRQLEIALGAAVVEPADLGYRFRHSLVREALIHSMPPPEAASARREVAERLAQMGASPIRVAHQYVAAGLPSRAAPYVLRVVDTAGALGAYRDALTLVDAVIPGAAPADLPRLLARRGDLLMALGDPEAFAAYEAALPVTSGTEHRLVRARLARAAGFAADLDTARAALAGLEMRGDAADGPILLAQGIVAYFSGDTDTAWEVATEARRLLHTPDDPWQLFDLVALQGLISHQRGEWFERFRMELRRTRGQQRLVTALFDAHLCVAEYMLYGPVPYAEVIREAEQLRRSAENAGALRGVAFATALIGEAALPQGNLELAESELLEAIDLHRDVDAPAGEAHCLQRLAEVRLAQGDAAEARALLQRALPLARWSVVSMHLLQRIYGTMITAAADPVAARAMVDQAEATLGDNDHCAFCSIMLAVPASIACADVGDLATAERHLAVARASAGLWEGKAWQAALLEAEAHLAEAEGRAEAALSSWRAAERMFAETGHVLDARRCAEDAESRSTGTTPVGSLT